MWQFRGSSKLSNNRCSGICGEPLLRLEYSCLASKNFRAIRLLEAVRKFTEVRSTGLQWRVSCVFFVWLESAAFGPSKYRCQPQTPERLKPDATRHPMIAELPPPRNSKVYAYQASASEFSAHPGHECVDRSAKRQLKYAPPQEGFPTHAPLPPPRAKLSEKGWSWELIAAALAASHQQVFSTFARAGHSRLKRSQVIRIIGHR